MSTVHSLLELEHSTEVVEDDVWRRVDHGLELKLFDDRAVFGIYFTPKPPKRGRAHDRAWFEFRVGGIFNVGVDVARPGLRRAVVASEIPWRGESDEFELETMIWAVRDDAQRLANFLAKKPKDVDLATAIERS